MKTTTGPTKLVLEVMTFSVHNLRFLEDDRFPKTLFTISQSRISEDDSSGDLLNRLQMHIEERDEEVLATQQWMRRRPRYVGGSWLF
jgi:hypothetical protein